VPQSASEGGRERPRLLPGYFTWKRAFASATQRSLASPLIESQRSLAAAYVSGAWVEAGSAPLVTLATSVVLVVCTVRRWARAEGTARRGRAGPAVAGTTIATVLAVGAAARLRDAGLDVAVVQAYELVLIATAAGLAADLRFGDWSAGAVAGLVIELGSPEGQTLSARLGRALGDPTLVVAYPLDDGRGYVDEQGRAVTLGQAGASRVVTPIRRDGDSRLESRVGRMLIFPSGRRSWRGRAASDTRRSCRATTFAPASR